MLKNILELRERRIEDVMIPRADIIAVQQDISLGELVRVFEKAAHSRLVVYNATLDELLYAAKAGFHGLCTNQHHQNVYGFMANPSLM